VAGSFWVSAAGVVAGALGTIAIILVTFWIGRPKRRLLYWMPVTTPLLPAEQDVRQKLEVRHDEQVLSDPQVLEVGLFNQGHLDIASTAFDRRKPLRLDVGAPIIEVLKSTTVPTNRALPEVRVDGSTLEIGPSLIHKHQTVIFSILVDGPAPRLTCVQPELIDVDVDARRPDGILDQFGRLLGRRQGRLALIAGILSLVLLLVLGLAIGHAFGGPTTTTVSCTINASLQPGRTIQLTYHFNSATARRAGLGAGLYDATGNDHSTGAGDINSYEIAPGRTAKSRPVPVPAKLPPGRYELDAELWPPNKVGQNGAQTIASATCGFLTVR
jgi:hypothetical protein